MAVLSQEESLRQSLGMVATVPDDTEEPSHTPAVLEVPHIESALKIEGNDSAADYTKARSLLYAQIVMAGNLTKEASDLAQATLNPRAFEAYVSAATLLRTLTQDLLSIQKTFKDIKKGDEALAPTPTTTTTNNISQTFVGTAEELATLVAKVNNEMDNKIVDVTDVVVK